MRELPHTRTFNVEAPGGDGAPELLRRCAALLESDPDAMLLGVNVDYGPDSVWDGARWVEVPNSDVWTAVMTLEGGPILC